MNSDIRLSIGFFSHPKTIKLMRQTGAEGVLCLQRLWIWAAQNRVDGCLTGFDVDDIEIIAGWNGEPGAFVGAAVKLRFLDGDDGSFCLHGWDEHQEYVTQEPARIERARKAAQKRWGNANNNKGAMLNDANSNANSMQEAMLNSENRNAPNQTKPNQEEYNIYLNAGARARVASSVPKEDMPDITFEQFADAYPPDKLDRDAAWIAWKAQHKAGKLPGLCDLFTSLEAWKASEQWQIDKGAYIPLASNFLGKSIYKRTPPANKARASPHRVSKAGEFNAERQAQIFNEVLADLEAEQHGNTENGQSAQAGSPICTGAQLRERVPEAAGFTLDASARAL